MTGNQYRRLIASYLAAAYGDRGIQIYEEVNLGTSIIGKQRRIDLFVLHPASGVALAVECKYQDSPGTVDEKIPYALEDLRSLRMPGVIVYAGAGFSEGVLHLLQCAEQSAYCMPGEELAPVGRKQEIASTAAPGSWIMCSPRPSAGGTSCSANDGSSSADDQAQLPLGLGETALELTKRAHSCLAETLSEVAGQLVASRFTQPSCE